MTLLLRLLAWLDAWAGRRIDPLVAQYRPAGYPCCPRACALTCTDLHRAPCTCPACRTRKALT